MRRGKPQQKLYTPGSGPLKKTTEFETARTSFTESPNTTNKYPDEIVTTNRFAGLSIDDTDHNKRKTRKPEQEFYVPKPVGVAQIRDNNNDHKDSVKCSQPPNVVNNGDHYNSGGKGRNNYPRRQGSEPRGLTRGNNQSWQRNSTRDTRSVEPNAPSRGIPPSNTGNFDKQQQPPVAVAAVTSSTGGPSKPPSGRRHSTIGMEAAIGGGGGGGGGVRKSVLPPRFQRLENEKRAAAEAAAAAGGGGGGRGGGVVQKTAGEWDGSSVTFQGGQTSYGGGKGDFGGGGGGGRYERGGTSPSRSTSYSSQNTHAHHSAGGHHDNVYYTLPSNRNRGRGRYLNNGGHTNTGSVVNNPPGSAIVNNPPGLIPTADSLRMFHTSVAAAAAGATVVSSPTSGSDSYYNSPVSSRPPTPPPLYGGQRTRSTESLPPGGVGRVATVVAPSGNRRYEDDVRQTKPYNYKSNENWHDAITNDRLQHEAKVPMMKSPLAEQLSPISVSTPENTETATTPTPSATLALLEAQLEDTLVWSEEVELCAKLEAEAEAEASDALTRSSSIASLMETSTTSLPAVPASSYKRNRKKRSNRNSRRSNSRDTGGDHNDAYHNYNTGQQHHNTRDNAAFKVPNDPPQNRGNRDNRRHSSDRRSRDRYDRSYQSRSRDRETSVEYDNVNWRTENRNRSQYSSERNQPERSRNNSERNQSERNNSERSRNNSERNNSERSRNNSERSRNNSERSRNNSERSNDDFSRGNNNNNNNRELDKFGRYSNRNSMEKTSQRTGGRNSQDPIRLASRKIPENPIDNLDMKKAGVLVLQPSPPLNTGSVASSLEHYKPGDSSRPPVLPASLERPRFLLDGGTAARKGGCVTTTTAAAGGGGGQKSLFDPNNPNKPIIVSKPVSSTRVNAPGFSEDTEVPSLQLTTDQYGNLVPAWYDENSEQAKSCNYPGALRDITIADHELQHIIQSGWTLYAWDRVTYYRNFLKASLEYLVCSDLRFVERENVETHFWKILYHTLIEMARKTMNNTSSLGIDQDTYRVPFQRFILSLIEEGCAYYEGLVGRLEGQFNFRVADVVVGGRENYGSYVVLALVSVQKCYIFLGDLLRYREQVMETANYGKSRQYYIKAHEINPKNGRPYSQLAVLAVYCRRRLDAVYYYMRSLMSSNPVQSSRESLISLLDDNRKKYEQSERKRREERLERDRQHMKEKESENSRLAKNSLRKETWIRPDGGKRIHRTTSTVQEKTTGDSDEDELEELSSTELSRRFTTSYLHVHGKLITRIGMETFHETAVQMLKEFRVLLQHTPIAVTWQRFIQLLALNMFAIDSTQLKDPQYESGYRSEQQERALVVSLQMFNIILARCVSILTEHINHTDKLDISLIPQDAQVLLPAVKIWCDWMQCHTSIWNPPPSTQDYKVGLSGDVWSRLATLMNLLEKLDQSAVGELADDPKEGLAKIRLPEDGVLSGFTPLMYNAQEPKYVLSEYDQETARSAFRITRLIFFGTVFLCGQDPPVLKLELENDFSEYISVVSTTASRSSPSTPPDLNDNDGVLLEVSDEENELSVLPVNENTSSEVRDLLTRKVELEKRHRSQELHRQRVQKILQQSVVNVHIEIKPKYIIPDTNCFIDYLTMLQILVHSNVYTLMVPLVVLGELEGLARGPSQSLRSGNLNADHIIKVAESAKFALDYLNKKHQSVKCITTKGTVLASSTFTAEDETGAIKNDDKILATCLTLCKNNQEQPIGEPRKLFRELVLITEDRNLRVKALARDVPVRELPDFMKWAGLG